MAVPCQLAGQCIDGTRRDRFPCRHRAFSDQKQPGSGGRRARWRSRPYEKRVWRLIEQRREQRDAACVGEDKATCRHQAERAGVRQAERTVVKMQFFLGRRGGMVCGVVFVRGRQRVRGSTDIQLIRRRVARCSQHTGHRRRERREQDRTAGDPCRKMSDSYVHSYNKVFRFGCRTLDGKGALYSLKNKPGRPLKNLICLNFASACDFISIPFRLNAERGWRSLFIAVADIPVASRIVLAQHLDEGRRIDRFD